jgi:DNA-binding CsgD family transcriptional regulator
MDIKVIINPCYEWSKDAQDMRVSHRELEVLALLIKGNSNKKIAEILGLQYQSVKNHMYHLMKTLKVKNAAQASTIAILQNLIVVKYDIADDIKFEQNAKNLAEGFAKIIEEDKSPKKKETKGFRKAMEKHNINLNELKDTR